VVIRRADSTGPSAGLTAVYKGTRHGDRIGGEFTSSWPGHWANKDGNWYATIGKALISPPAVMRDCSIPAYNYCATLTWNNGHYDFVGSNGNTGEYTVLSFTQESVVLRGTVHGQPNFVSMNSGKISADGNRILSGDWSDNTGRSGHFTAAWGSAMQDLPGGGEGSPRPQPQQRAVICYAWFFGLVCQ